MKKIFKSLKMNFFALGMGALLAVSIFYVVNDPSVFQANVLGVQDKDLLVKQQRDLGYKFIDNTLDVYISAMEKYEKIYVFVDYDFDNINLLFENIENQGIVSYVQIENGTVKLNFDLTNGNKNESLFVLPFVGEKEGIVVSEAHGVLNGELVLFDIGGLDSDSVHR